jgi:hypothetical protein
MTAGDSDARSNHRVIGLVGLDQERLVSLTTSAFVVNRSNPHATYRRTLSHSLRAVFHFYPDFFGGFLPSISGNLS